MSSCREEESGNDLAGNGYFEMYSSLNAEIAGVKT
jgi:hypothetical protein